MLFGKELKEMSLDKGILGNTIREARIDKNLSQEKLAEMLDITPTHLKHIESEYRNPSVEVLFHIVQILHISLDDLLLDTPVQTSKTYRQAELLLQQCQEQELKIISDIIKSLINHRQE